MVAGAYPWPHRAHAVVPLTPSRVDLVLEHLRQQVLVSDLAVQALAEWLGVHDLGPSPLGPTAGLWIPRDVAIAGLREAAGKATGRPFMIGLRWLRSREFFRPHVPSGFEADPLAILAVAIGIHHIEDEPAKTWIASIAAQAVLAETDPWRKGMLAGALSVAGKGTLRIPEELSVALAAKGAIDGNSDASDAAFYASLSLEEIPAERAAVRLAVLSRPFVPSPVTVHSISSRTRVDTMKVLILAANPASTNQLSLDEEVRSIDEKIRLSEHRRSLQLVSKWAVRPDDLQLALLQCKPTFVHFIGHGAGGAGIVLHGDIPGVQRVVTGDALAHLFGALKKNIRVVLLNSCESTEQAEAIAKVVDFVIGMNDKIDDESARRFAASFYLGIASGESVNTSFCLGVSGVKLHGLPDEHVPRLYVRYGASADEVLVQGAEATSLA